MLGFIALPALPALALAVLVIVKRRSRRNAGRYLNDVGPVSGEWLADHRRSG
jgi:hypothetical protein